LVVRNPGLRTLLSFLRLVGEKAPATFTQLSKERRRAYGMVGSYIGFCLRKGLIRVVNVTHTRGPRPSKQYDLTERGSQLLKLFEGVEP